MTNADLPEPGTTLAVLLGASAWPQSPKLASGEAFLNSALHFRNYLVSKTGHGMSRENVLDLFDDTRAPSEIDESIANFLKERTKIMTESGRPPRDLIVYYVGHGGFVHPQNEYFLAVRATSEDREGTSGFRMSSLASTLRLNAPNLRRYLILDCCFSAQAYKEFQSAPLEVATRKTVANFDDYPGRGTALLCSSGARDPSRVPAGASYTMFSGALLDVLQNGQEDGPPALSLKEVGEAALQVIRSRYDDTMVRPEVQSPDMRKGDVARIPLFANGVIQLGSDIARRLTAIEKRLTELEPHVQALSVGVQVASAVVPRVDAIEGRLAKSETTTATVAVMDRQDERATTRNGLREILGVSRRDWSQFPTSVKIALQKWHRAKSLSYVLLLSSILLCSGALMSHFGFGASQLSIGLVIPVYLATLILIGNYLRERLRRAGPYLVEDKEWEGIDIIVEWRASRSHGIIGMLFVVSPYYEGLLGTYMVTTIVLLVTGGWHNLNWVFNYSGK